MSLVAVSIRLDRIEESLLFEASDGSFWLSCVCTYEEDAKGRMVVAQSISKERYAAGEKGPALGTWREIGGKDKPAAREGGGFNLAKYKATAHKPAPGAAKYHDGQESLFSSPQTAFDVAENPQQEPKPPQAASSSMSQGF